jgi:NAD(P)-dependent dehydrogenase (short-subunit alcohol dehydrogenase family)
MAGRTAVVTGCSRGLGYAMAEALGREGAELMLVDVLDSVADAAARLDEQLTGSMIAQRCDGTDAGQVAGVFDRAADELGTATILVNAAGVAWNEPALNVAAERWRKVLDVNITGTFLPCQPFARARSKQDGPEPSSTSPPCPAWSSTCPNPRPPTTPPRRPCPC